ncbi:MAG TPA: ABC transporter substrate-binding protein [Xanthobacteraceae bacterium]|nr:ABC transporter substrate-binding protein [Xanthobacteraceae bacterium]
MSKLSMTFACGLYDRMFALQTGEVQLDGIDMNFVPVHHPRDLFDRMVAGKEFDASEMSASEYITRHIAGKSDFIAIPVFPSRMFRHGFITVNTNFIKSPKDLEGKKIGVQLYTMTAAVWIRALLAQDLNLDLSGVEWVEGAFESPAPHGKPTVLPPLKPVAIIPNRSGKSLSTLLEQGEVQAVIGADLPQCYGKAPHIKRLFEDFKQEEKSYYKRTGVFPIMHLVVLRRGFYEKHPFVATSLFNAFEESKSLAQKRMRYLGALRYMLPWLPSELDEIAETFGDEPWPYGVESNRPTLEALIRALVDQSMAEKKIPIEELFAPVRAHNWNRDTSR